MKKIILTIILLCTCATSLFAFGKNKVQYQYMRWNVLDAENYMLYYHQDMGSLPREAYVWLDDIYRDLEHRFGVTLERPVPTVIYGAPALFEQTNIITEILPEEVGGFTELFKNRIAVPFNGSPAALRHVLHHEMVHAFVFGAVYGGSVFRAAGVSVPLWFNEGLAEILSVGWDHESDMYMLDRVLTSHVPLPGFELSQGYIAYRGGQSFLYYLHSIGGDSLFNVMIRRFVQLRSAEEAIEKVYGQSLEELGREWHAELRRIYWPEAGRRMLPTEQALRVTNTGRDRSRVNLRPRISHDGESIAFISDRADFMRVVITDKFGKVQRTIGQHSASGSFESFQPLAGAIAWSPDSRELAFVAKDEGRSDIRIVNARRRGRTRRVAVPLDAITGLDWSRDGNYFALTGIRNGRSGLYMYDIAGDSLVVLDEHSPTSKSSPRFSPCGANILFASEDTIGLAVASFTSPRARNRPSTNLTLYNIENRESQLLANSSWNDNDAAFSPSGDSIVFVSDRNGVANLYIANINDVENTTRPLTDYTGNISTPDWAADGSAIVFQLFMNQNWNIWRMEHPQDKILDVDELALTRWALSDESNGVIPFFRRRPRATPTVVVDDTLVISAGDINDNDDDDDVIDNNNDDETLDNHEDKSDNEDYTNRETDLSSNDDDDENISENLLDNHEEESDNENYTDHETDLSSYEVRDSSVITYNVNYENTNYNVAQNGISLSINHQKNENANNDSDINHTYIEIPDSRRYRLRFTPDMVLVGLGMDISPNNMGAAGVALVQVSDILGDHRITLMGDIQIDFSEYAQVFGAYEYLKLRTNLSAGGFYYKYYSYDGSQIRNVYHDTEFGGFLGASYPFSMFSRVDGQLVYRYLEREHVGYGSGSQSQDEPLLPLEEATDLIGSVGYSFDNILWGITGPLRGFRGRARLQLAPPISFNDASYVSADFDLRHYLHPFRRFVWANRFTAGASFPLGDDEESVRKFILGGNHNWLNFWIDRDNYDATIDHSYYSDLVTPLRGWRYFDFVGDRYMLANSEWRFPFIREVSTVWPLPMRIRYINGAFFIDGGYAWDAESIVAGSDLLPPRLAGGYGFGMRMNIGGMLVLRYDRGWPLGSGKRGPMNYFSLGAEF